MKKSAFFILLLIGIFMFTSCDINIFSRFEDIPVFTETELEDALGDVPVLDDGTLDLDTPADPGDPAPFEIIVEEDDSEGDPESIEVHESLVDYVGLIDEMTDNDTLDEFEAGGGDLDVVADNLEIIIESVLEELGLIDPDGGISDPGERTFEEIVDEAFEDDFPDGVPDEDVEQLREVLQEAAAASVAVQLAADDNAGALVEDTADIVLGMLGGMDIFGDRSRGYTDRVLGLYDDDPADIGIYNNLATRLQIVLEGHDKDGDPQSYVLFYKLVDDPENPGEMIPNIKFLTYADVDGDTNLPVVATADIDGRSSIIDLTDFYDPTDADLDYYVIDPGEADALPGVTLAELLTFVDAKVGEVTDGTGTNLNWILSTVYGQYVEYFPSLLDVDLGGEGDNPVEAIIDSFSETITVETFDSTIATFDEIGDSARGLAATVSLERNGEDFELTGLTDTFLTDEGYLNSDGFNFALMGMIGLGMDYTFKLDSSDPIGIIPLAPIAEMIKADDAFKVEMFGTALPALPTPSDPPEEGDLPVIPADEFMRITINYAADMLPYDYDEDLDGNGDGDFPLGLQEEVITRGTYYDDEDYARVGIAYLNHAGILEVPYFQEGTTTPIVDAQDLLVNPIADIGVAEKLVAMMGLINPADPLFSEIDDFLDDSTNFDPETWL